MPLTLWRDSVDTPAMAARVNLLDNGSISMEVTWYRGTGAVDRHWIAVLPADATQVQLKAIWELLLDLHVNTYSVAAVAALRLQGRRYGWPW